MGKWKIANILEMASRRAKQSEIWDSGVLEFNRPCMHSFCILDNNSYRFQSCDWVQLALLVLVCHDYMDTKNMLTKIGD